MRRSFVLEVLVSATLLSSNLALAQFSQQGPKLVGAPGGFAEQGVSVSLSADGNTAIIGGPAANIGDPSVEGAAWVWIRSGGVWSQQGTALISSFAVFQPCQNQGASVSLSADGNTAIIGSPNDVCFGPQPGEAWIWTRNGAVWTQQGTELIGSGAAGNAAQGKSVSISADGNTAIVGGHRDNGNTGAAWIWTRSGNVWTQQGGKLIGSGGSFNARQGRSVALSADGNTAIVGGYQDGVNVGTAWVWTRSGGVWTQQGNKLVGSGAIGASDQGFSVSLSADGNTAAVAGPGDDSNTGAVWIWTRSLGVWTQQGSKLVGGGAAGAALQGNSVSISADGNTVFVGGPFDNGANGAAWVWTRSGGVWTQLGNKLVGSGAVSNANQGTGVGIAGDGKTAIVGGPFDNGGIRGAVWIFVPAPDLGITKSMNGGPSFPAGGNLSYIITVVNNGLGAANSVVVSDTLPAGASFVSATPSQGSCSGTTTVSCALGGLATGGTATITLVLKTASTPGTVSNTATVTASEVDLNPANNSSTSTINTIDPALLPAASIWVLAALAGVLALLGAARMRG
jgi:uncharacterized repeat protein (TIGR01451 family)